MNDEKHLENFQCQECGTCCRWSGFVIVTPKDIKRLANYLKISETIFIEKYTTLAPNRNQLTLIDHEDGSCIFLQEDRCKVYQARPEQCRNFPFTWQIEGCPALDLLEKY